MSQNFGRVSLIVHKKKEKKRGSGPKRKKKLCDSIYFLAGEVSLLKIAASSRLNFLQLSELSCGIRVIPCTATWALSEEAQKCVPKQSRIQHCVMRGGDFEKWKFGLFCGMPASFAKKLVCFCFFFFGDNKNAKTLQQCVFDRINWFSIFENPFFPNCQFSHPYIYINTYINTSFSNVWVFEHYNHSLKPKARCLSASSGLEPAPHWLELEPPPNTHTLKAGPPLSHNAIRRTQPSHGTPQRSPAHTLSWAECVWGLFTFLWVSSIEVFRPRCSHLAKRLLSSCPWVSCVASTLINALVFLWQMNFVVRTFPFFSHFFFFFFRFCFCFFLFFPSFGNCVSTFWELQTLFHVFEKFSFVADHHSPAVCYLSAVAGCAISDRLIPTSEMVPWLGIFWQSCRPFDSKSSDQNKNKKKLGGKFCEDNRSRHCGFSAQKTGFCNLVWWNHDGRVGSWPNERIWKLVLKGHEPAVRYECES